MFLKKILKRQNQVDKLYQNHPERTCIWETAPLGFSPCRSATGHAVEYGRPIHQVRFVVSYGKCDCQQEWGSRT